MNRCDCQIVHFTNYYILTDYKLKDRKIVFIVVLQ
jgi:hypothetical protein